MQNRRLGPLILGLTLAILPVAAFSAGGDHPTPARGSWQEAQAEVDAKGDLTWKPRAFVFEKGASVRYIDFLCIAHGTLADADTTIEELYTWEFDGPFPRDFPGRNLTGPRRAAGALEKAD